MNTIFGARPLPDIILLDLNMPIMDGFGFLDAFRSLNIPGKDLVKIIIVSSSVNPRDMDRAKRSGSSHYLSKPVTEQSLRRALEMCEEPA
ncbi:response regulator [Chryseolinea serpens]|uniref:response regulator n=1 Tax=Chryseolinea serpens TaxID=947013 RepID=UPI0015BF6461